MITTFTSKKRVIRITRTGPAFGPEPEITYFVSFADEFTPYPSVNSSENLNDARDVSRFDDQNLCELLARLSNPSAYHFTATSIEPVDVLTETTLTPIDKSEEVIEILRSMALSKLSPTEIAVLGLERFACYDKLKNYKVDSPDDSRII